MSVYPLAIEEGTPFDALVEAGELPEPDPDAQADMMLDAERILRAAGMERYEVASYAYPGYACKHNQAYWTGVPYLGLGRSAVSMRQSASCRQRLRDGQLEEELGRRELLAEDLMLGMRLAAGLAVSQVEAAEVELPGALAAFHALEHEGLVCCEDDRFKPTTQGWLLGNRLYGRLLELGD